MLMILTSFRIALRYCQPGCLSVVSPLGLVNFAQKKKKKKKKKNMSKLPIFNNCGAH